MTANLAFIYPSWDVDQPRFRIRCPVPKRGIPRAAQVRSGLYRRTVDQQGTPPAEMRISQPGDHSGSRAGLWCPTGAVKPNEGAGLPPICRMLSFQGTAKTISFIPAHVHASISQTICAVPLFVGELVEARYIGLGPTAASGAEAEAGLFS